MTLEDQILIDLLAGQSTASSIAGRVRTDAPAAAVILNRMERDGLVFHGLIMGHLEVWKLTTEGRLRAQDRKPHRGLTPQQTPPLTPTA
jgi:hypothetical protein